MYQNFDVFQTNPNRDVSKPLYSHWLQKILYINTNTLSQHYKRHNISFIYIYRQPPIWTTYLYFSIKMFFSNQIYIFCVEKLVHCNFYKVLNIIVCSISKGHRVLNSVCTFPIPSGTLETLKRPRHYVFHQTFTIYFYPSKFGFPCSTTSCQHVWYSLWLYLSTFKFDLLVWHLNKEI